MQDYFKYTTKARLDKSINTLLGILEGIAADKTISAAEWDLLVKWLEDNKPLSNQHPYFEIVPILTNAMADGKLTIDEHADITYLCEKLRSDEYYNLITADIQRLHALLMAISSDGVISQAEVESLGDWIADHEHLRKCWPFDEVDSLITDCMKDQRIDPSEQRKLLEFFGKFNAADLKVNSPQPTAITLPGICAVCPEIIFDEHSFCFTGESSRASKEEMKTLALDRGARVVGSVSQRLNYLVVGSQGNPCWAYACYGRKIEQAVQLRQQGAQIMIVHEADFFDAL